MDYGNYSYRSIKYKNNRNNILLMIGITFVWPQAIVLNNKYNLYS